MYRYEMMEDAIKYGRYPNDTQKIINSMWINEWSTVLRIAFWNRKGLKYDYEIIQNYMDSARYKNSKLNYDDTFIKGRAIRFCLKLKKPDKLILLLYNFCSMQNKL